MPDEFATVWGVSSPGAVAFVNSQRVQPHADSRDSVVSERVTNPYLEAGTHGRAFGWRLTARQATR